jgi:hypothetical protein
MLIALAQKNSCLALPLRNHVISPKFQRTTRKVFAPFQFDPEATKDIDENDWPGVILLKVQMNADFDGRPEENRASNESFTPGDIVELLGRSVQTMDA